MKKVQIPPYPSALRVKCSRILAVNEFHAEVMPLLSTGDQNATMALIKNAMENGMLSMVFINRKPQI